MENVQYSNCNDLSENYKIYKAQQTIWQGTSRNLKVKFKTF